jgi:aminoglycoside phosphotransferase (APT) family kinase protein
VPDLRLARLPGRYAQLLEEVDDERLRRFEPRFAELCAELAARGVPETIQHDDLHQFNVYVRDGRPRILDWGDASVGHPYFSLVATLRHVEDRGITRAFLDAWGGDEETLALALRVGRIAHTFKLRPLGVPDDDWPRVVALAVAQTSE